MGSIQVLFVHSNIVLFIKITYEMCVNVCCDTHIDSLKRTSRYDEYLSVFQPKAEVDRERLVFTEDSVCG